MPSLQLLTSLNKYTYIAYCTVGIFLGVLQINLYLIITDYYTDNETDSKDPVRNPRYQLVGVGPDTKSFS